MKQALSAAVALALGIGLAATAQAHGTMHRHTAVRGADMKAAATAPARHVAKHQQASRQQIMQKQRMLQAHGLYRGRIDGIMGPKTQTALAQFQRKQMVAQKARKPATKEIGVGSSRPDNPNATSGSGTNMTPTPTPTTTTQAPGAGSGTPPADQTQNR